MSGLFVLCRSFFAGVQEGAGVFFAGRKAHEHKRQRTGNRPRDCRAEAEGLPQQLPHDRHRKARAHTGQDPGFRRLFPVQRRKGGQARGGRIKAPGKHQDIVRIFDIQRDEQRAQRQDHREHTRQPQLLFLRDIGPEDLVDIMHAGLYVVPLSVPLEAVFFFQQAHLAGSL